MSGSHVSGLASTAVAESGLTSGFARRYVAHVKLRRRTLFTFDTKPYEKNADTPSFATSAFLNDAYLLQLVLGA